jgi:hypothetical protein
MPVLAPDACTRAAALSARCCGADARASRAAVARAPHAGSPAVALRAPLLRRPLLGLCPGRHAAPHARSISRTLGSRCRSRVEERSSSASAGGAGSDADDAGAGAGAGGDEHDSDDQGEGGDDDSVGLSLVMQARVGAWLRLRVCTGALLVCACFRRAGARCSGTDHSNTPFPTPQTMHTRARTHAHTCTNTRT